MNYLVIFLVFLGTVSVSYTQEGCLGPWCSQPCPEGEYRYSVGCDHLQREPNCRNPHPPKDTGPIICDYTACYCNPPTVRDEKTKKCVKLINCFRLPVTPKVPVTPRVPVTPKVPVTSVTPKLPVLPAPPYSDDDVDD